MKKLLYLFLTVLIVACSGEDSNNNPNDGDNNGNNNQSSCNGDNPVYLADNGVTIKACPNAQIGDTGNLNGFTYTIVSEQQLRDYVSSNYPDLNRLVTTQVTDMRSLLDEYSDEDASFNQDISSWDVSNVTDMSFIFYGSSSFNQDISSWDVSNVTGMSSMFYGASSFNQPIGYWDVSNVTNMFRMLSSAVAFNQDISSWNVDGVTYCEEFSYNTPQWTLPQPNFTNCWP